MNEIKLGSQVKDKVSGFHGIASGCCMYLSGCRHIQIQPKVGRDGKLPEAKWFDEPMVEMTGLPKSDERTQRKLGGPMLTSASR